MPPRLLHLPLGCALAVLFASTAAVAGPPPPAPPPSEGTSAPPTSAGVRTSPPPAQAPGRGDATPSDPLVDQRTPSTDLTEAWGYSSGSELQPNYVGREATAQIQINPVGYYQGVTLEGDNLPPFAPPQMGAPAVLTWTGFEGEKAGAGSRVFLQLTAAVDHHLVQQPEQVTLRLPMTSVNVRNNMRRLDTSYFKTPVSGVDITHDGPDTVVQIRLRRAASSTVQLREGSNGYKLLVVEFSPEGTVASEQPVAPESTQPGPES